MCYQLDGGPPHFSQVVRQYLNHRFPKPMDWSWRCTELATKFTGSVPIRLLCVRLLESYGVCTQGEHVRRIIPANSHRCKKRQQRRSVSQDYKLSGHTCQTMCSSRGRKLRTTCMSVERRICNCTFNNTAQ
jgi:hypothetical protein